MYFTAGKFDITKYYCIIVLIYIRRRNTKVTQNHFNIILIFLYVNINVYQHIKIDIIKDKFQIYGIFLIFIICTASIFKKSIKFI